MRIQEVQSELPRGCIPRSLEVILRAECVEKTQAGDRCDFIGTLIVVPDVSKLASQGNNKFSNFIWLEISIMIEFKYLKELEPRLLQELMDPMIMKVLVV